MPRSESTKIANEISRAWAGATKSEIRDHQ